MLDIVKGLTKLQDLLYEKSINYDWLIRVFLI